MSSRLGFKAGFGTPQAMAILGTSAPLFAPLTTATLVDDGGSVRVDSWAKPVLEAEIAVRIGHDGEIAAIAPAIELADLHGPLDDAEAILSHGIYHRAVILGEFSQRSADGLTVEVLRNGAREAGPADALALIGDPREVLRQIADRQPGDVIITGATVAPIPITPGDAFVVRFHDLGEVSIRCA